MNAEHRLISDLTVFSKYARFWGELGRRETYEEIVARNRQMHLDHISGMENEDELKELIDESYRLVFDRKVFPSMRSFQFGGEPIHINNSRIFNCAHRFADEESFFGDLMYLLLGGVGVGYSVQKQHVAKLPAIQKPDAEVNWLIEDSIEGWSLAVDGLAAAYLRGGPLPVFDYSQIRPQGAILKTSGGRAPGPEPLKRTLDDLRDIFESTSEGSQLAPIQVHDMATIIARAVLSGGIRRSAMISLFSPDDEEMLNAKAGAWWEINPSRAFANNSAVLLRGRDDELFHGVFAAAKASGAGEPGVYWVDDLRYGTNPCKPLESLILTTDGYITFEQALERDSLEVVLADGSTASATAPFKTGENRVVTRFTLSNGTYLYGTDNHLHQTPDGDWVRMDEVEIGDRLAFSATPIHKPEVEDLERYNKGVLAGWIHADGWLYQRSDASGYNAGISIGVNELNMVGWFEHYLGKPSKPHYQKPDSCRVINLSQDQIPFDEGMTVDKSDLTWLYGKDADFKLGFIRAAFTADGSVRKNNNVELYSIRRPALEVLSNILREFGIYSTVSIHNYAKTRTAPDGSIRNNSDTWKLNVYAGQFKQIGMLSDTKQQLLEQQVEKPIYRYTDYVTVTDIEPEYSVEDVYDITVHNDSHCFLDSGVVTHNCAEITLNNKQFCNLTTMNVGTIESQEDFNQRARVAAIIGTLQASYTDFNFLSEGWKEMTEEERLLGVSMTGIASGAIDDLDAAEAAAHAVAANEYVAGLLGINPAARVTAIKPEGTASLVAGTSSGIHAWHDKYYIRRIRYVKAEPIAKYLIEKFGIDESPIVEQDVFNEHQIVVSIPQEAPEGAATREEGAEAILERVKRYHDEWIKPGNRYGGMPNNISATINIQDEEWDYVENWMWNNRYDYNGLSLLPYSDHTYQQAPFESCTREVFEFLRTEIARANIDLTEISEVEDYTDLSGELACAGGACEIPDGYLTDAAAGG